MGALSWLTSKDWGLQRSKDPEEKLVPGRGRSPCRPWRLRADPAAKTTQTAPELCSVLPEKLGCKH